MLTPFGGLSLRPGIGLALTPGRLRSGKYLIRLFSDFQYDRLSGSGDIGRDFFRFHLGFALGFIV